MSITLGSSFALSGKSAQGFYEAVEQMDKSTHFRKISKAGAEIWSLLSMDSSKAVFLRNQPLKQPCKVSVDIANTGLPPAMLSEMRDSGYILAIGEDAIVASPELACTLAARAGVAGESIREQTPERDTFFAACLYRRSYEDMTIVERHDANGHKEAFAAHSDTYVPIPQAILKDIAEAVAKDMGGAQCLGWHVDHKMSEITLLFPEKGKELFSKSRVPDKIVPGIRLRTSDTGDTGFSAHALWLVDGQPLLCDCYRRMHRGSEQSAEQILECIRKGPLASFDAMPGRIEWLLTQPAPDMKLTLGKMMETSVNKKPSMSTVIGKKLAKALLNEIADSPAARRTLTAYDAVYAVMRIPAMLAREPAATARFKDDASEACGRAATLMDISKMLR